ncbi:MAG: carbonic anhydrase family protein [Xanthobacteraceae bacterium]
MHRRSFMRGLGAFGLCPLCAPALAADAPHRSYEGASGPDHWGELDAADKICGIGTQQSPIDVVAPIPARLPPLVFGWSTTPDTIVNNGHTIRLDFAPGSTLLTSSDRYTLVQFHFHHPAEHLIAGKRSAMELHFVHTNAAGNAAAVGVMMVPGKANAMFHKIVQTMPSAEGPPVKADTGIDPNGLLPGERSYFRYAGSLTIPPCGENIEWSLLRAPIEVAEADIAAFAKLYAMNARPLQKDNRRYVLQSG